MKKFYVWKLDESKLSNEAKKLNEILCKELNINSPKNFDKIKIFYEYYYFEGEYEPYSISLGLLIDNFEVYEHANYILEDFESSHEKSLLTYIIDNYCPDHECLGGDILTSGEYYY